MFRRCFGVLLATLMAGGCEPAAEVEPPVDHSAQALRCGEPTEARQSLYLQDRLHSLLSQYLGYQLGFLPLLDDNVTYLAPGQELLHGREEVSRYLASVDPDGSARLRWDLSRINTSADGRLGYSFGWTNQTKVGDETPHYGRNIVVWRRTHASWRVVAYVEAPSGPPQATPPDFPLFPRRTPVCQPGSPFVTRAAVVAADRAFASRSLSAGIPEAFRDFAAPDGVLRAGGRLIIGPAAIYALFAPNVSPGETLDWVPVEGGGAGSGDLGYTIGLAVDSVPSGEGVERFYSKYLTVWERQPDRSFRYVVDGGNGRPAPSGG